MIGQIILITVKTLRNTNLVATKRLKGKKASPPVDGGNFPLIPGYFFPGLGFPVPLPRLPEGFLYFPATSTSTREATFRQEECRGKVRCRSRGKNKCLTWNSEQPCMVHRQELQTTEYLQKWDNLSKNQGEIRTPTKRKKNGINQQQIIKTYTSIIHATRYY